MKFQFYKSSYIQEPGLDGYEDFSSMPDQVSPVPAGSFSYFKVPGFAFPLKLSIAKIDIVSDGLGKHAQIIGAVSVPNDNIGALSFISFPLNGDNSWSKIRVGALLTLNLDLPATLKAGNYFGFGMGSNYHDDPNESKARSMQGGVFIKNTFVGNSVDATSEFRTSFGGIDDFFNEAGLGKYNIGNTTTNSIGYCTGVKTTSSPLYLIGRNGGSLRDLYFEIDRDTDTFKFFIGKASAYAPCSISQFKDRMKVGFNQLNVDTSVTDIIAGMNYIDLIGGAPSSTLKDITLTCYNDTSINIEAIAYKLF